MNVATSGRGQIGGAEGGDQVQSSSKLVATIFGSSVSQREIEKTISALRTILDGTETDEFSCRYLSLQEGNSSPRLQVVDVTFHAQTDTRALEELRRHDSLRRVERECHVEIVIQRADQSRKQKRLAVFDMDSTLIQQEVIDELARVIGVEDEVSAITARAMNGELDFTASLQARVALLQGVPNDVWERLKAEVITFTPGARELCRALKTLGFKLAVLSGGFTPLAEWVKEELGLDYTYANNLISDPSTSLLTGHLTGPIVDATRKALLLEEIANNENVPLEQTIAIGDGANDLLMMRIAATGVAFNAKERVKAEAPTKLTTSTLLDVLYILGYTEQEREELLSR